MLEIRVAGAGLASVASTGGGVGARIEKGP